MPGEIQAGSSMNPSEDSVSICIATHERPQWLRPTLEAIAQQTVKPLETVVSDSSSDDRSRRLVEQFASDHPDIPGRGSGYEPLRLVASGSRFRLTSSFRRGWHPPEAVAVHASAFTATAPLDACSVWRPRWSTTMR